MKVAVFTAFFLSVASLAAHAVAEEWVLAGEQRKRYLNCNYTDRAQINWTEPVLRGGASPQGIEREGQIDGRVLYEARDTMSIAEWTLPTHDRRIDRLVIHLAATDMRRPSALRVQTRIVLDGGGGYGDTYSVYATPPGRSVPGPAGALISPVVARNFRGFELHVIVSDGGGCSDVPVIYYFRRVR